MSSRGASANVLREPTDLLEALAESERRLQCVIELSSDCYWETDEHCRFTLLRHGAGTRLDDHLRAFLGKARWELGGEPVDGSWDEHKAVCRARRPFTDLVVRQRDDRLGERYFSISGQPVFEGNGRFRGYRGLTRNITREKRDARLLELDHKVLRILAGADDPDEALEAALGEICRSEGWDAGQYWALDKRKAVMRFHVGWNAPDAAAGELAAIGISHVAADGRFIHVNRQLCEMRASPSTPSRWIAPSSARSRATARTRRSRKPSSPWAKRSA